MLLIEANRDTLLKPLQAVTGIVERRHTLPILSNVLIEHKQEATHFMATDLEIQVSTSAPGITPGSGPFALTVAARKLHDILRSLPENAKVSFSAEDSRLQVKAGSSRFNLHTLPAEDFPKLAEATGTEAEVTLPQKEFKRLLSLVQYAMAQQDIRYYLNGLLLALDGRELRVVATDGHRLALASAEIQESGPAKEAILPRKAVLELVKLLAESSDPVRIELHQNQARFTFSGVALVTKVVDGKFPDYLRVIPQGYQKHVTVSRVLLLQALQRAAILSNEKIRGVRLVLTSNGLRIICTNNEQEEAQEEIEVAYSGEPLDIGFNVTYLLDVLGNLGGETVQWALGDPNSSALITVPGDERFKYVVMPMRI